MGLMYCTGHKCKLKNNCLRYLEVLPSKDTLIDFTKICNKNNNYLWLYLTGDCKNKKIKDVYKKRIKKI